MSRWRAAGWAVVIVLAPTLVIPPAGGQTPNSTWSTSTAQPVESAGEVVLTFTSAEPGRVVYYTSNGDCSRYPWDPADCGRPQARAGEDYRAVKGEWIFTEAGSRTIRIEIFDDDRDEADHEAFGVHASQYDDLAEQTTWFAAVVRLVDDDPRENSDDPPARTALTATTTTGVRPSKPSDANAIPGSDHRDAEVQPASGSELASGELEPGPGPEPVIERDSVASSERDGGSGDSASWLALALGTIALGSGGVVWVLRRRRWSRMRS